MKPDKCRGKRKEAHYNYLSEDFQYLRSTKAAVAHLKSNGFTQDAVNRLISKTHDEGKKLRPDKYDWIDGDESVPDGWKLRIVKCSNGESECFPVSETFLFCSLSRPGARVLPGSGWQQLQREEASSGAHEQDRGLHHRRHQEDGEWLQSQVVR